MEWKADRASAAYYVGKLVASYPQSAPVPEVYMEALIELCIGKPEKLLAQMATPEGILGKCKYLPSVAELKDWLANEPYINAPQIEFKPEPEPEIEVTQEEVERRLALAATTGKILAETGKSMMVNHAWDGGNRLEWEQEHAPSRLLEALENLEDMKPGGEKKALPIPHRSSS